MKVGWMEKGGMIMTMTMAKFYALKDRTIAKFSIGRFQLLMKDRKPRWGR